MINLEACCNPPGFVLPATNNLTRNCVNGMMHFHRSRRTQIKVHVDTNVLIVATLKESQHIMHQVKLQPSHNYAGVDYAGAAGPQ